MAAPKIAIVVYSMYGHIGKLAEHVKIGLAWGASPDSKGADKTDKHKEYLDNFKIFQIAETLPQEVLTKMHAPEKPAYDIITPADLVKYDAILFGVPTRYGNMPAQYKAFWDATGGLWLNGLLWGKYAGVFVSTGTPGGGQEMTVNSMLSTLTHHGMNFVPLGYKYTSTQLSNLEQVHGGSPWGAGTFAGGDGSRQPTDLELQIAEIQGKDFYNKVSRVDFSKEV